MKNYTTEISQRTADNISNYLAINEYNIEFIEGDLMDGFICKIGANNLKLSNIKMRKFIIVVEKYINEWTSALQMILTDDEDLFNQYYSKLCIYEEV